MRLPILQPGPETRQVLDTFGGYNHNLRISDAEFYDVLNLSSDRMPVLSQRGRRGRLRDTVDITGMLAKDALCYTEGRYFCMNQYRIDMGLTPEPKKMVSMGAYVIILPDKKYINTADVTDWGNIEASFSTTTAVRFSMCMANGDGINADYIQDTEPAEPENGQCWIDLGSEPHSLKQWSESTGMWVGIASTYIKLESPNIGKYFKQFDGVRISGLTGELIDSAAGVVIHDEQINAIDGSFLLWGAEDDHIIVVGFLDHVRSLSNTVTIERRMPILDFIIESENRLWGCRYGTNDKGDVVNEIYACKLGDFKNWECFMGISTDSYMASCGTDGRWTGAVTHLGHPLFFKENYLHKIYGNIPANFQIQTTACRGVQDGCEKSLAIVNETLFYKARHAVVSYDGSLPQEVSAVLGEIMYGKAVAEAHGNKLYISMEENLSRERSLFILDTAKGIWEREDDPGFQLLCSCRDEMYGYDGSRILSLTGSGTPVEGQVEWMATTGIINAVSPERAYLKKINIRMTIDPGSVLEIFAQYDSLDEWVQLAYITGRNTQSFEIPVRPRRCDHLRLKMVGTGPCFIYSMSKILSGGSEKP